jgi:putative addiction module killer protein
VNYTVKQTEIFRNWYLSLRDVRASVAISRRVERAEAGNLGDVKPVGEGVSEMRIDVGAGYRAYFTRRGETLILLLCGGNKSTQSQDIKRAIQMAKEL